MSFQRADAVLRMLGRLARTSELKSCGVTEAELTRAVRASEVLRVRRGVYALPGEDDALIHAASHGGVIGCCEAGVAHGLWILEAPEQHHVWLGRAGTPRGTCEANCRFHWDDGHVTVGQLPPVANVLLQIAVCTTEDTFFAALESALRRSLLSPGDIAWLWSHLPVKRRWLLGYARSDADSGLESLLRLRLHRLGIEMRSQVMIDHVGEVDFVIGERLIIEADGRENHAREAERAKDLRRDAIAASLGYTTLRFTYSLIVHQWRIVEAAVLGALRRGTHR
ncbi:type IV toxin-antitoxin system AbiEi family antitoxin domain-containing protein [Microbacterium natoriense]|uniref:type IV toxin-antitoxin system AbiEi family antitoxin domain-containing protein n=1 Tax=Microbacterium natoriense TaxID=284570 RepID=UPI0031DAC8D9